MYMQTLSGKKFHPSNPTVESIDIGDIAHALSNMCRFAGHVPRFYSVAQHSVIVSRIIKGLGGEEGHQLYGLLHDATEAYLMDMPTPVKILLPDYKALEERVRAVICQRFGLELLQPDVVYFADAVALATEAKQLMGNPDWGLKEKPDATISIVCLTPAKAKRMFLKEFRRLSGS